jgi:hypothetical protein
MGGLTMTIKEKIMDKMMDNQFKEMSAEDRKHMMETMMDKFFSTMSMMMGKKADRAEKGNDNNKMPWDRCSEMMSGFKETANTAKFATPELRGLFDDWCQQIEKEILDLIKKKKSVKVDEMAEKFSLSEESIKYLLSRLANKNLIDYKL